MSGTVGTDSLFLGLTRPPLLFGVSYTFAVLNLIISLLAFVIWKSSHPNVAHEVCGVPSCRETFLSSILQLILSQYTEYMARGNHISRTSRGSCGALWSRIFARLRRAALLICQQLLTGQSAGLFRGPAHCRQFERRTKDPDRTELRKNRPIRNIWRR